MTPARFGDTAAAAAAECDPGVQRALALIMSKGPRGIRPEHAIACLSAVEDISPGLLQAIINQSSTSERLERMWVQLIRQPISASDHREFLEALPRRAGDWRRNLITYPVAIELAEAIDFPRPRLAASHVGAWISRIVRESQGDPTPEETRVLAALAVLGGEHEGKNAASSVYMIMRGRGSSVEAMDRARAFAPHADSLLRVVPEMVHRGAGVDSDLLWSMVTTVRSGAALLDGQL